MTRKVLIECYVCDQHSFLTRRYTALHLCLWSVPQDLLDRNDQRCNQSDLALDCGATSVPRASLQHRDWRPSAPEACILYMNAKTCMTAVAGSSSPADACYK